MRILSSILERNFKEDGEINRKSLGEIVFSNKDSLNILNQITHPRLRRNF